MVFKYENNAEKNYLGSWEHVRECLLWRKRYAFVEDQRLVFLSVVAAVRTLRCAGVWSLPCARGLSTPTNHSQNVDVSFSKRWKHAFIRTRTARRWHRSLRLDNMRTWTEAQGRVIGGQNLVRLMNTSIATSDTLRLAELPKLFRWRLLTHQSVVVRTPFTVRPGTKKGRTAPKIKCPPGCSLEKLNARFTKLAKEKPNTTYRSKK